MPPKCASGNPSYPFSTFRKRLQDTKISNARGVLFDVDGTLYHQNCLRFIVAIRFAMYVLIRPFKTIKEIGIVSNYRNAQEWLRKNVSSDPLTLNTQLDRTVIATGISYSEISACIDEWIERVPLRFLAVCARRKLLRYIHHWYRLKIPMGVYSDYKAEEKLKVLGLRETLSVVICSMDSDVSALKPDPRGFEIAASKMGLSPSQMVYVGDREDVDAIGAENAGMTPIIVGRKKRRRNMTLKPKLTLAILDRQLNEMYSSKEGLRCVVCESSNTHICLYPAVKNDINSELFMITDGNYGCFGTMRKCDDCGLVFTSDYPASQVSNFYRNMVDLEYLDSAISRRSQMKRLLEIALRYNPQARSVLDVGAAVGLMILEAKARGLEADGIEPSRWCVRVASEVYGIDLFHGALEDLNELVMQYDLVMLIDVLEHSNDPLSFLRYARNALAPGGRLIIVTPDIYSPAARIMGKYWWHCRTGHLCFFSRNSIRMALRENHMHLVDDLCVGWIFPIKYLCKRLKYYLPFSLMGRILDRVANSKRLGHIEVPLNFRDSRMFVAKRDEP